MNSRRLIVRALLLISLLSPFSLRAFGSRASSPSCQVPASAVQRAHHNRIAGSSFDTVLASSRHRSPAQRMHRLRGKRIHLDQPLVFAPTRTVIATETSSPVTLCTQNLGGPNPPRGPPLSSL